MDAKSLLRAKKASARIEHRYAAYSASGQLRCSVCAVPVKQWDAHLLTKAHRQSVAREKEEAARAAKKEKRKAAAGGEGPSKRAKTDAAGDDDEDAGPALPEGFFSAGRPSIADPEPEPEPEPEREKEEPTGDVELDDFLASLDDAPAAPVAPKAAVAAAKRRGYKEPEEEGVASYSAAPVLLGQGGEEAEPEPEPEESEAERRARLAREEREEIMARLEEEERAQEDADERVSALKERVAAMKRRREMMKAKGGKAAGKAADKEKGAAGDK